MKDAIGLMAVLVIMYTASFWLGLIATAVVIDVISAATE